MGIICTTSYWNHFSSLQRGRSLKLQGERVHTLGQARDRVPGLRCSAPLPQRDRPASLSGYASPLAPRAPANDRCPRRPSGPALLSTPCAASPAARPAYLQAQGGPAASQELTNVAQALALAPGLRIDLQHRAEALSEGGRPRARPEANPQRPQREAPGGESRRANPAVRGAPSAPALARLSRRLSSPAFLPPGCTNLSPLPSPGSGQAPEMAYSDRAPDSPLRELFRSSAPQTPPTCPPARHPPPNTCPHLASQPN